MHRAHHSRFSSCLFRKLARVLQVAPREREMGENRSGSGALHVPKGSCSLADLLPARPSSITVCRKAILISASPPWGFCFRRFLSWGQTNRYQCARKIRRKASTEKRVGKKNHCVSSRIFTHVDGKISPRDLKISFLTMLHAFSGRNDKKGNLKFRMESNKNPLKKWRA